MGKRNAALSGHELVQEAARILCEERLTDYRLAKLKAAERIGLGPHTAMPGNAEIQEAVIDYQALFGGDAYRTHLMQLRRAALEAMELLADFAPRLVGAAVTGAAHAGHCVQLHCFTDAPETLDLFLIDRGIDFRTGERRYRFPDGRTRDVAMIHLHAGEIGIDIAVFDELGLRQRPISPTDGLPMRRLDPAAVAQLLREPPERVRQAS